MLLVSGLVPWLVGCPVDLAIGATQLLVEEAGPLLWCAMDVLLSVDTVHVLYLASRYHFRFRCRSLVIGAMGWR